MFTSLFGRRSFLEEGLEDWCLDAWAWLMRNLGGVARLAETPLVLANADFFAPTTTEGEARAAWLFERVKALMGMEQWDCELRAVQRRTDEQVGEFWRLRSGATASGSFQLKDNRAIVSYAADMIADPRSLVAVFAHELCHYRLASFGPPPRGQEIVNELLTDLAVAYFGFGVFAANAAFHFEQHQDSHGQGWSSQRQGYLSERSWAFAIALFLMLKDEPLDRAKKALKPNIADLATKAERYLTRNANLVSPLRAIA